MIEPAFSGIRLLVPWSARSPLPVSRLAEIDIREIAVDGAQMLAVGSSESRLLRECHAFLLGVADLIQLNGMAVDLAIREALKAWQNLLSEVTLLSLDAQVGLLGELWVAYRLVRVQGPGALRSWIGPASEPHDFRLEGVELEVKATRQQQRRHIISSLGQLLASPGQELYLVSFQLEPSGTAAGTTIPEAISRMKAALGGSLEFEEFLERHLEILGYKSRQAPLYTSQFRLRSRPTLIRVDENVPVLSSRLLQGHLVPAALSRIDNVTYTINVDGLGWEHDSSEFQTVLPKSPRGDLF
jgi:hypothetical protein